jgi:muramoyltetrapeptide carboxypeptidase
MSEIAAPLRSLAMPSPLGAGARVALIAPAGPLAGPSDVANAEANARALGWEPVVARHALGRYGYFAGTDAERLRDLQAALDDPSIDGVWCLRGGYGTMRLLPALDRDVLRARPRALIGFSDITALHAAWQAAGLVSFHGPVARNPLGPFSAQSMRRAVIDGSDSAGHAAEAVCVREGVAEGRLLGGNLALVAALVGTPWALSFRDAIVVLEDVHEATYRMDRMLVQLRLAGAFDGCRGLVFGQCTDCPDSSEDGRRSLHDLVAELAADLGVPALLGVPVGHIAEQWTLPFGAVATLDATAQSLHLHRSTP